MADYQTPPPLNPAPAKTSSLAVTSLVLGILGTISCGFTAIFGLIFGIIALIKVKESKGALAGDGLALAGIIISAFFILVIPFISIAMVLPVLAAAKQKAQTINCVSNEKQLALAIRMYSDKNANHFPPAATWCDAIKTSVGSDRVFKCPSANPADRCDYAFNAALDGMDVSKVDPNTVMIFESDAGWNGNGGPELMVKPARHQRGRVYVVAYADGSVQMVRQSELDTLRWNP